MFAVLFAVAISPAVAQKQEMGLKPSPRGLVIPGMALLPIIDGATDDWNLNLSQVPDTRCTGPAGRFGDFYLSWRPEGLAIVATFVDFPANKDLIQPDSVLLTLGFRYAEERPVLFTLSKIQQRISPTNPASPLVEPEVKSVSRDFPFPVDARFFAKQSSYINQKIIEIFLPARLFGREELEAGDILLGYASLRMKADGRELSWPRPFNPQIFKSNSSWVKLVLEELPDTATRPVKKAPAISATEVIQTMPTTATVTGLPAASSTQISASGGKLALAKAMASPSPFKPGGGRQLRIEAVLNKPAQITVIVYDQKKNIIKRFPEQKGNAGPYRLSWNGVASNGRLLAKGNYIIEIIATNGVEVASQTIGLDAGGTSANGRSGKR